MNDTPIKPERSDKRPLILLLLVGILVISTLVVASEYFLRPQIETELETYKLYQIKELGAVDK